MLSEGTADALRAAYYYAMVDDRPVVDVAMVRASADRITTKRPGPRTITPQPEAAPPHEPASPREVTPPREAGVGAETGDAPDLREARWWVRRDNDPLPGVDPAWSISVVDALAGGELATLPGDPAPVTTIIGLLGVGGGLEHPRRVVRWMSGVTRRILDRADGPVLIALEMEAARQAVRRGRQLDSAAVILAVLSLDEQLAAAGQRLMPASEPANQGGAMLRSRGVTLAAAQEAAAGVREEVELSPRQLVWGHTAVDPSWTAGAVALWDAAKELAGGGPAGTTHLVRALEVTGAPAATAMLAAVG
ncbi:hypothetical protein GCM10010435_95050 [Winogradskya consettensis]|uniref:Uncharacterized protein n=1 Tax=Winogradskya consettensis TaxID=113560 RepID=A0A919T1H9_9ACTN|nr:hypothetical protein Aco04nite_90410 [Actinoplanes consettensis]